MYTQCHRSTDTSKMPQKVVHRSRLLDQVCAWGGGGKPPPLPQPPTDAPMYTQCHRQTKCHKSCTSQPAIGSGVWGKPPPPPQPPTPAETKPSQAKPQFRGRPVYLPSPPTQSPEFPILSVAKPTRSDPSRARPLFLTVSLSGTDTAKPSPNHFFQGDHVYESPPSLFCARNPLPRYLYLTQRVPSRVCSRRCTQSAIAPQTQTKCHKSCTCQPAIGSGVCLGGRGQAAPSPQPPTPAETKPSQAKPSQASLKAALFISQAPRLNLPNSPPSLWPSQPDPTPAEPGRCF